MIGALHYETQVAQAAAEQVGMTSLSAREMTPQNFVTIALLMSICIIWGMVLSVIFNKGYLKKLQKNTKKGSSQGGFGDHAMSAMFIGLVSAYIGSYIGGFDFWKWSVYFFRKYPSPYRSCGFRPCHGTLPVSF